VKVCQEDLAQVLRHLPEFDNPNLIFGFNTVGDAGVYKISDDIADAQTSGGLLIVVEKETAEKMLHLLHERGLQSAKIIGEVLTKQKKSIVVY